MNRDDTYYEALKSRDPRFDGKFFVGVKTTGIYCRPICPAKPKRENVRFYKNRLEAERAGFRPCLRCRPESAPLSPAWIGTSAIVKRAMKMLTQEEERALSEDEFAAHFGVSARHLRRLFRHEVGKTPKQLHSENRLNLSRKLISETSLPLNEIAFASGFRSVRRFNDAFKTRFARSPSEIRRTPQGSGSFLKLSLPYRPPFDFDSMLHFYETHRPGLLEWYENKRMHRIVEIDGKVGEIIISNDADKNCLWLEVDFPDLTKIHSIIARVRNLFDLDSDPILIANSLEQDASIKIILKKYPGIRLPSGWDPFEIAISTILGQLVSVAQARALTAQLIDLLGKDSGLKHFNHKIKLFPTPQAIVRSSLTELKTTQKRKQTLIAFSQAILDRRIRLNSTQNIEGFFESVLAITGIGPWSANYIALKALRHTDAFPASDLILARALELHPRETIDRMSPWRGYVAALFWRNYASLLTKTKRKKK